MLVVKPNRIRLRCAAVCLLSAGLVFGCGAPDASTTSPAGRDLVLITVDTLRADAVGAYDPSAGATPTIDALAQRGLRFTQATAPMPRTTPSLASLLSGRSPKHHGSREVGQAMSKDVPLLSQILKSYVSVAVTGNRAASSPQGLDRGFDVFHLVPGDKPSAEMVTQAALDALDSLQPLEASRPLFLWVHYVDPHFPYEPPGAERDACSEAIELYEQHAAFVFQDQDGVSSRADADCTRRYRAEVSRADAEIGRLLEGLRKLGRPPEEALVVFTSDHGENLSEDGLYFEHGPSLHDAALRVPLIAAGPGIVVGQSDQVVELQDLAPTLLALLGVRPDAWPPMEGRDLSRLWLGKADGEEAQHLAFAESNSSLHVRFWRAVVAGRAERHCVHEDRWSLCGAGDDLDSFQLFDHEVDPMLEVDLTKEHPQVVERLRRQREVWPPETARSRAVRGSRFKLVEEPVPSGGYERRLYDLQIDPAESRDVMADHPRVAERLGRALDEVVTDLPTPGQVARDDEELEALRALGYVE